MSPLIEVSFHPHTGGLDREPLGVRIGCGGAAGIMGWLCIYPLDVLRSRVMSAPLISSGGGWAVVAEVARETYARLRLAGYILTRV